MQWAYLFVMAPCVTAVAYPWTVEHGTVAAGIAAGRVTGSWSVWQCLHRHLKIQLPSAGMKKKDLHWHLA